MPTLEPDTFAKVCGLCKMTVVATRIQVGPSKAVDVIVCPKCDRVQS